MQVFSVPENTDSERLAALNRHNVSSNGSDYFTLLTHKIMASSLQRFADYLIAVEKFREFYGYKDAVIVPSPFKVVMTYRLQLWVSEGRAATAEEDKVWLKVENDRMESMRDMYELKGL